MAISRLCSITDCSKKHVAKGWCEDHYRRFKRHGDPLAGGTPQKALPNWIDNTAVTYDGDECLIWPFGRHKDGYAQGRYPGYSSCRADRIICELVHGAPPSDDHQAAHSCGKGRYGCVNPKHLRWATPAENEADKLIHGTIVRGSRHKNAKLTEGDVTAIRAMLGRATHEDIAAIYGVTRSTVSLVASGATWSWLT